MEAPTGQQASVICLLSKRQQLTERDTQHIVDLARKLFEVERSMIFMTIAAFQNKKFDQNLTLEHWEELKYRVCYHCMSLDPFDLRSIALKSS
jgi:hypothetical protein